MKPFLLSVLCVFSGLAGALAQINYDTASIPAKLRENAHVIKRYENSRFEVKDIDRAVYSIHEVYTILDEQGQSKLNFTEFTNKLRKIDDFEIKGYNAQGVMIEKFRKKDLSKQAVLDGLASDGMIHYMRLTTAKYPVTVEFKYEIEFSGTVLYPAYQLQGIDESVEYSSFTAKVPAELDLRYKEQRTNIKPQVTTEGNFKVYRWEVKNMLPFRDEDHSVVGNFFYPSIILAPNRFKHYNTYGEMTSWKSFGKWAYDLMNGIDELPAERKQFFVSLVKNAKSDREKAAIIYDYLQKNFRYVSIQLGIGGVKPFPAQFTDEKKYGDCKGLSFFMHAALKAVDVKSYCAIINAGYNSEPVAPDFPCDRFNHEILCIPLKNDTVWLECTSNDAEFGVLGTFTENRNALLLTENGGVLVSTPASKSRTNRQQTTTHVNLNEDGSGTTSTAILTTGKYRSQINSMVAAKKDEQKVMIVEELGFKQPDEFTVAKKSEALLQEVDISLSIEKIPQFMAGSKMFLNQRLNRIFAMKMPAAEGRTYDFYFQSPFYKSDTTIYHLPASYTAEVLPKPATFRCDFGEYTTSYTYNKETNELTSIAVLELKSHIIPAQKYASVKQFFDSVMSDETQKLIVKKN